VARALQHESDGRRDFYEVLGVTHDATSDEIRRAYRSLALQFHPDRNSGSSEAEERFKELAEAFHTLSDEDRREIYDLWGPRSIRGASGADFDPTAPGLDDAVAVFVEQFSAFVNEELRDGWDPDVATDHPVPHPLTVRVSLAEVATGTRKQVPLPCFRCAATGVERSHAASACRVCGGSGEDPMGETVRVDIPPGVSSGDCIRVHRSGASDLLAFVDVEEDPRFVRAGADVVIELPLSVRRGPASEVEVPTPTGSTRIRIPPGTGLGGALRIPGHGLPARTRPGNGDLIVKLVGEDSEGRRSGTPPAYSESYAAAHAPVRAADLTRSTVTMVTLAALAFLLGGTSVGVLSRARSAGATETPATGLGLTIVLVFGVAAAFLFLVSSVLAFTEIGLIERLHEARRGTAAARSRAQGAMERFERRLRRFAVNERRHPARPLVVQLDRLAYAVENAGSGPIATLTKLERRLSGCAAQLGQVQPPYGWSSEQVAQRLRESARHSADSFVAAPLLLITALSLATIDFWVLRQAITPLLPAPAALPFPLSVIEPAGVIALLLAFGAVASGALRQALEPLELGPVRGERVVERRGYPLLLGMGPTLMALVVMVLQTLCFFSLSGKLDLATRLGIPPESGLAQATALVVPIAGAVLTLLLVSVGYGFWLHVRQAFAADADGAVARRLRRHSERRGAVPMDVQSLRTNMTELASTLDGFSRGIADEFVRTTGFEPGDQGVARSVRAAAARVSERGGVFVPRGIRSLEQVIGGLVIGFAGFGLLVLLAGLLLDALTAAFATAEPFAQSAPALVLAAVCTLVLVLGGYALKDAVYGSNHVATLHLAIPHRRGRRVAAAVAGTALLIGIIFVGWLGVAGEPLSAGAGFRSVYLVLLAAAVATTSSHLDGWIVSAYKVAYLAVNGIAWTALATASALLTGADWFFRSAAQTVGVVSIPGQWVRAKAFRPT
jgi:molecular chaperone DnaJ